MRKITVLILIISVALFNACKNKDIETVSFKIGEERAIPTATSVVITGSYAFAGTIKGMKVSIGEKENLNDASLHDMNMEETYFSVTIGNLKPCTEYYYRFSVEFGSSEPYLTEVKTFTTLNVTPGIPTVKALEWLAIDETTIRVKCEVVSDGNQEVTERGICWNTYGDPTTEDETLKSPNGGLGQYTIRMDNLDHNTRYYVRAYAKNAVGIGLSEEVLDFKLDAPVDIVLSCNPIDGGVVSGGGSFHLESQCTVTATANAGYDFVGWTENNESVSSDAVYTFTVLGNRNLVANFTLQEFHIYAEASPEGVGTVTGAGDYSYGTECILIATPMEGYGFENWTENGNMVSENAEYSFIVTEDRNLVAHFFELPPQIPIGAINGLFSINDNGDQVYFSRGNLQYQASTNTWRFAENQYDHIGEANNNISSSYEGWIDLFGWGTSGYNHNGNGMCFQPWSTSTDNNLYYAYGQSSYSLFDQTGQADWGYNAISNGGNTENAWHTLPVEEWTYLFNGRNTTSGILFAKAKVEGVGGIILLPDDWNASYFSLTNFNNGNASFNENDINATQWTNDLQSHGAVFLPVTGYRIEADVSNPNSHGYYNLSSSNNTAIGYMYFGKDVFNAGYYSMARSYGRSVRLVYYK